METFCPHRYDITFSFSVIGIGKTKEEAIQEAIDYGIQDMIFSGMNFDIEKTVLAKDMDTCDICEKEREE